MIGWYLGIAGIFVGIAAGFYFIVSLSKMKGNLAMSMSFLVAASFIYVVFSSLMVILGFLGYEITNLLWQIIPTLFLISTVAFFIGTKQLVELVQELQKKTD